MPYFQCRLATEGGGVSTQSFLAPSREACRKHFEDLGLCILSIKRDWKRIQIPDLPFEKKIKDKDFIMFNRELVALIKAGYPILKSIEIIILRVKNIHLKEMLMQIESEVRAGKSLSEAFSSQGKHISTVYIASLMAGERSGNLDETIRRYIKYESTISRTKSRIKTAMTYPTILLIFSFALMAILVNFIIPKFSQFYQDFETQLPWITTVLLGISLSFKQYFYVFLLVLGALLLIFVQMRRKESSRVGLDRMKLMIPYGKQVWIESAVALFSRTLGLLLEGGISLLSAVGIARQAVPNRFLIRRLEELPDRIKNGESLSDALSHAGFFTPLSLDMIRIGERSANLEGMLADLAETYDERIQTKIDAFVSLLTPLVIIFMGILVALMLLSVYIPIFNIIQVTR